jgi:1-acyl-sn-glycerol-3-phosphate acyltransferase
MGTNGLEGGGAPHAILAFPFVMNTPHIMGLTPTGLQLFQAQTLLQTGQRLRQPHHGRHMGRSKSGAARAQASAFVRRGWAASAVVELAAAGSGSWWPAMAEGRCCCLGRAGRRQRL